MMHHLIYKLATTDQWHAAKAEGLFKGAPVDLADGFIHYSTIEQVRETAAKHFRNVDQLLLLTIDVAVLEVQAIPLKWEPSRGGALFPHLYCPMPLEAVVREEALPLSSDGNHTFPADLDARHAE